MNESVDNVQHASAENTGFYCFKKSAMFTENLKFNKYNFKEKIK